MDMAIMTLQITGLYQQALTEWERMLPAQRTWDNLKTHFADAYNTKLISGTSTTGQHGFASNTIDTDDALNNIELSLNHELSNLQVANNANHQSMQQMMSAFTQQLATVTQQLALLLTAPTAGPTAPAPIAAPMGTYATNTRNNRGGNRGRNRNAYINPNAASPLPVPTTPLASTGIPAVAPTPATQLNNNKFFNNHNYCFTCGYDVPVWHTSDTCPHPKPGHQRACTRGNVMEYTRLGHQCSRRTIHKTIMPANPRPEQA